MSCILEIFQIRASASSWSETWEVEAETSVRKKTRSTPRATRASLGELFGFLVTVVEGPAFPSPHSISKVPRDRSLGQVCTFSPLEC